MDKYDRNILDMFQYYNRSYSKDDNVSSKSFSDNDLLVSNWKALNMVCMINKNIINCLYKENNDMEVISLLIGLNGLYEGYSNNVLI
jgi:hypothetical protein